jgi:hypothetical protein
MERDQIKRHGDKHRYWQHHLDQWHQSGLSQQRYCAANQLSISSFHYWRRKLRQEDPQEKPRFYPLSIAEQTPLPQTKLHDASLRLHLGGDRFIIAIDDSFSPALLGTVVTTLEQL